MSGYVERGASCLHQYSDGVGHSLGQHEHGGSQNWLPAQDAEEPPMKPNTVTTLRTYMLAPRGRRHRLADQDHHRPGRGCGRLGVSYRHAYELVTANPGSPQGSCPSPSTGCSSWSSPYTGRPDRAPQRAARAGTPRYDRLRSQLAIGLRGDLPLACQTWVWLELSWRQSVLQQGSRGPISRGWRYVPRASGGGSGPGWRLLRWRFR